METSQKSSGWGNKLSVKKGDLGEKIVDDFLRNNGIVPYYPNIDSPHPFDRLCTNRDGDKIFIAEIKSKAKRTYYPDTGINISHCNKYKFIINKYKIPIFVFFIDEQAKQIYGEYLENLLKEKIILHENKKLKYPLEEHGIIYFPLESMRIISGIDDESAKQLKELSTRNYKY